MRLLFVFCLVFVLNLCARVESTSQTSNYEGLGVGQTREESIQNALADALGKMRGVHISKEVSSDDSTQTTSGGEDINFQTRSKARASVQGKTPPYELIYANQQGDGSWEASVVITHTQTSKKYVAPGLSPDSRRSIVVLSQGNHMIEQHLRQKIISALNKSRKFNVLDRESKNLYDQEKALLQSSDTAKDEALRLGQVLGTDYILFFNIQSADAKTKTSNLTGQTRVVSGMSVDYRIILMATRQIKYANTIHITHSTKNDNFQGLSEGLDQIAMKMSQDILNNIYPLRVAQVRDNEAVFAQSLHVGDVYECFSLGDQVIDSYTKESAGRAESKVGEVEILRADPKISYAKILQGKVEKNHICRPAGVASASEGKESSAEIMQGGGVKLGF